MDVVKLIARAHQEAHRCNATTEVHDWIDWFKQELNYMDIFGAVEALSQGKKIVRDWYSKPEKHPVTKYIYFDFGKMQLTYSDGTWKDGFTNNDVKSTKWTIVD